MRTVAIVNPHAAGRRTGRLLPELAARLSTVCDDLTVAVTEGPADAERMARQALRDGARRIVAVGGDGTVGDVVNGFFVDGQPMNAAAELAVVEVGTGGDFRRSFGMPDSLADSVRRIAHGAASPIDVGRAWFTTGSGETGERCFANIASFGMSADVAERVNRAAWLKAHAGGLAYTWGAAVGALRRQRYRVRLSFDGGRTEDVEAAVCAVCNGRYFGGGMHMAPGAAVDDGLLDVVLIAAVPKLRLLRSLRLVYSAGHCDLPFVRQVRVRSLTVQPLEPKRRVPLELDGDTPDARLPARFEVMPRALLFRR